jgi:hypothetical protein
MTNIEQFTLALGVMAISLTAFGLGLAVGIAL